MHQFFLFILGFFCQYFCAMQVDVLIIGQGICGSFVSWFLHAEGKSFVVIDDASGSTASNAAAGVINPVTGRRYVTAWMAEEVIQFAELTYKRFGNYLNTPLLNTSSIIDFFPTPQMRNSFVERIGENDTYLHTFPDQNLFNPFFNYDFGCGKIRPVFTVHQQTLLKAWRKRLMELNALRNGHFNAAELELKDGEVRYHDMVAQKIIFCDGVSATNNPWFNLLPFSPNKGEALIVRCDELPRDHIYKRGMMLVPLADENLFWLGSDYQWEFGDDAPSEAFFEKAGILLRQWLKAPYSVVAHKAAVRPATLERRPFVGFHPYYPALGILNGMGTKGTSLAPFFAHQLVQHLVHGLPLLPEANVQRFSRILSKA